MYGCVKLDVKNELWCSEMLNGVGMSTSRPEVVRREITAMQPHRESRRNCNVGEKDIRCKDEKSVGRCKGRCIMN